MTRVLVTGGAGFIGSHLVDRLVADNCVVTVLDNFDPFYDANIKRANIAAHLQNPRFQLIRGDIRDLPEARRALAGKFDVIVHLAAKAGVRPSIQDPHGYETNNVNGTHNMLDLARDLGVRQFIFASSSSV